MNRPKDLLIAALINGDALVATSGVVIASEGSGDANERVPYTDSVGITHEEDPPPCSGKLFIPHCARPG